MKTKEEQSPFLNNGVRVVCKLILKWFVMIVIAAGFTYCAIPKIHYRSIVIHHTASVRDNRESLRRLHRSYVLDAAYHLILSNGSTNVPLGHLEATRWYTLGLPSLATRNPWYNLTSIQLCVVGNYEEQRPDDKVKASLGQAVAVLQQQYGIPDARVRLHRACNATLCPGKHITASAVLQWKDLNDELTASDITSQHRAVVQGPYLFGGQVSILWSGLAALAFLLFLVWRLGRKASAGQSVRLG